MAQRLAAAAMLAAAWAAGAAADAPLRFSVPEGGMLNEFYRDRLVAAHLVLRSGPAPRIVFAFPAGNSGAAMWLEAQDDSFAWRPGVVLEPAELKVEGGVLRGVSALLSARGGAVTIRHAMMGSVRVIREFDDGRKLAPELVAEPRLTDRGVTWRRRRLDGAPGYSLSVEILRGRIGGAGGPAIVLHPDSQGELQLRATALTGDAPLTPLAADELVTHDAAADTRLRQILAYLSYREKLLAGSWRFNTYFGRDTLMSLCLLAPALQPQVMEAGLGAVLERLNRRGEVAHEEDIGEFAILRRVRAGQAPDDSPILDYKMIDDDYMLAPVAALYLLEPDAPRVRAATYLARLTASGDTYGAKLVRNLRFVVEQATPFARNPDWKQLVRLKSGMNVGNWRDSENGLGGGRYPYDVNGVLVPAALDATARLHASGLLERYLDAEGASEISGAAALARVWLREAPRLFEVSLAAQAARTEVVAYSRSIAVDPSLALAQIDARGLSFRAVALDAAGRPVPVLNSDEAFALLFLEPASAEVERIAETLMRPFPAGLMTTVGLVVADAAFAGAELGPLFAADRYHGAVIWSWQQALFAAGLDHQLARRDLTPPARQTLERARARLRGAIRAAESLRGSELWSWSQVDGVYHVDEFGQRDEHETESNAAQLWSTVHLAWR